MSFLILNFFLLVSGSPKSELPETNKAIVEYIQSVMGTQVGNGECTELMMNAQFLANKIRREQKLKKSKKRKILPGDLIQFRGVYCAGISFPNHVAIIMEVKGKNHFVVAHQNHNGERVVSLLEIDFEQIEQGEYQYSFL